MFGTTIMNGRGDLTIAWDQEDDEAILNMIESKMKEGFTFFIIEPRLGGMASPSKTEIADPKNTLPNRIVSMKLADGDRAVAGLIEAGAVKPVPQPEKPVRGARKAKTAREVAKGESIAVKPARGG
jgi:hypothetical protein